MSEQSPHSQQRGDRRMRPLAQSIHVAEEGSAGLARRAGSTLALAVIVLGVWAGFIPIEDQVATIGQVVPKGDAEAVRHPDGGTVGQVLVAEGAMVEPGQILVRFAEDTVRRRIGETTTRQIEARLLAAQLRALNTGLEPDFAFAEAEHKQLAENERIVFAALKGLTEKRLNAAQGRVDAANKRLGGIGRQAEKLAKEADLLEEELLLRKDLYQKKLTSKDNLARAQRNVDRAHRKLASLADSRDAARKAVKAAETARATLDQRIKSRALEELRVLTKRMDDLEAERQTLNERMGRLEVKAASKGLVRGIQRLSVGASVEAGGVLAEIVPISADTVVEVRIPVAEIDRTRPGLPVTVRVKAPGFRRYAAVSGELTDVSAATFQDENGNEYYVGSVALSRDRVGRGNDTLAIEPGMKVGARLLLGSRSVFQRLAGS